MFCFTFVHGLILSTRLEKGVIYEKRPGKCTCSSLILLSWPCVVDKMLKSSYQLANCSVWLASVWGFIGSDAGHFEHGHYCTFVSLLPSVCMRAVKPFIDSDTGHFECGNYIYVSLTVFSQVFVWGQWNLSLTDTGHFECGNYIYR